MLFGAKTLCFVQESPPTDFPFSVPQKDATRVLGPGAQWRNLGTGASTQTEHFQCLESSLIFL